jgi:molybdenum cofactor biosynthesis enzyme MoaA
MKIIRVEPTVPVVSMSWMIGSRCNYSCSYCPDDLHDDHSPHPELEKLKLVWQNFHAKTQHIGLPYKISFTGGEVTANKSFLPLIEFLRQNNYNIQQLIVSTNGSASTAYYLRLANLVNAISFSTHSEFWDEHKFFDTVIAVNKVMVRPEKSCHVNIMDEPWDRQNFARYQALLDQHRISYSINKINFNSA